MEVAELKMLRFSLGVTRMDTIKKVVYGCGKEEMFDVEVTEELTEDRNNWRMKIRCGDPSCEKPKEEEDTFILHPFRFYHKLHPQHAIPICQNHQLVDVHYIGVCVCVYIYFI